jgi:hypothetical protein
MKRRRRTYKAGEAARRRHAWLELVTISGPFLTLPVADRVFPDGLPEVPMTARAGIRTAVAEMFDSGGANRRAVVETVLGVALDWTHHLRRDHELPAALAEPVTDHGLLLTPDFGFYADTFLDQDEDEAEGDDAGVDDEDDAADDAAAVSEGSAPRSPWRLLGMLAPWGAHPLARTTENGWVASPVERLAHLLRARDIPIGLVTDGRWWALVWAPVGGATGAAVWDAGLWSEEPESFAAFVSLLTRARFVAAALPDTLPAMLRESQDAQEEVTETLGRQVRDAVELLLGTLDRLDAESGANGDPGLLAGVADDELYDGAVTVMMRIVFLLFAEERRLLPSDDHVYVASYSVSRLVEQLRGQAELAGSQTLEHRTGAWHRLLALTRALHSGVAHEDLRLPAYGGGLFDPDRFPWLEGRTSDGPSDGAITGLPPAVDDRTVMRMLESVQYVTINGERRRLTFRALDVEQIGYVYEGLLELEVRTASEVTLCLHRPKGARPWPKCKLPVEIPLREARARLGAAQGPTLVEWVAEHTGWSKKQLEKVFASPDDAERIAVLRRVVGDEPGLIEEVRPYLVALRFDERGLPAVVMPGRRYVAPSTRRAATGTHYTPRALAEDVVGNTLEPLAYRPGPLETSDRAAWRIRPSDAILDLRVADIAMGSGAFLVAACRYLADRLLDAWVEEGRYDAVAARSRRIADDVEIERVSLDARRLVAEHCLYGVDINPLAVEMAKLSLWLVTMDRERPFGFLDDRLLCGDSLLGLATLDQLEGLHLQPVDERTLDHGVWAGAVAAAADLRRKITAAPVVTMRDVEHKQRLLTQARQATRDAMVVADAVAGVGLRVAKLAKKPTADAFKAVAYRVQDALPDNVDKLIVQSQEDLQAGRPPGVDPRRPLHWPLSFPEVFADARDPGFDAIVGNPPFSGGKKISGVLGDDYLAWLQRWDGRGVKGGNVDLAARFLIRAERLLSPRGQLGYITTNTLVQGDTLKVGLLQVTGRGLLLRRGVSSHPWPSSSANLEIVNIWASRVRLAPAASAWLDGEDVPSIGADLEPVGAVCGRPEPLRENEGVAYIGSFVNGLGFTMTPEQASALLDRDQQNADALQPYVIGKDLNQRPDCSASRWVINFQHWTLDQAEQYPDLIDIVRRLVKPERDGKKRDAHRKAWWQYADRRVGLYAALAGRDQTLALAQVSSTVMPVLTRADQVFAHKCIVFALDDFASLAMLSSAAHTVWVVRYTATMRNDISYSPTDVFRTLPRPESSPELEALGCRLDTERRELMLGRSWGLTTTYNHVHDPTDSDPAIANLREIHAAIDHAVLAAYGWSDLAPEHGHHPTKIGTRWTVSKTARFALLDRLLAENHRRHSLENL